MAPPLETEEATGDRRCAASVSGQSANGVASYKRIARHAAVETALSIPHHPQGPGK